MWCNSYVAIVASRCAGGQRMVTNAVHFAIDLSTDN